MESPIYHVKKLVLFIVQENGCHFNLGKFRFEKNDIMNAW